MEKGPRTPLPVARSPRGAHLDPSLGCQLGCHTAAVRAGGCRFAFPLPVSAVLPVPADGRALSCPWAGRAVLVALSRPGFPARPASPLLLLGARTAASLHGPQAGTWPLAGEVGIVGSGEVSSWLTPAGRSPPASPLQPVISSCAHVPGPSWGGLWGPVKIPHVSPALVEQPSARSGACCLSFSPASPPV